MKLTTFGFFLLKFSLIFLGTTCYSQEELVARATEVIGSAIVVRANGARERLERRHSIYSGDSEETGSDGGVQLRFSDSSLLVLRCESRLRVHSYQYQQSPSDHVTLQLLYGGLRGLMAQQNYRLETPGAVVVGENADFELAIAAEGEQYFGVYDGAITIESQGVEVNLGPMANADFGKLEPGLVIEELSVLPSLLGQSLLSLTTSTNVMRNVGCSP